MFRATTGWLVGIFRPQPKDAQSPSSDNDEPSVSPKSYYLDVAREQFEKGKAKEVAQVHQNRLGRDHWFDRR